jgi:hypothetical protein
MNRSIERLTEQLADEARQVLVELRRHPKGNESTELYLRDALEAARRARTALSSDRLEAATT